MKPSSQEQFMKLVKPIANHIQAYVQHLAWNQNDVEDIFQTSLLNAFTKFHTFQEGTNFKAWMFKFVTFTAFNVNRKHSHLVSREVLMEADDILSESNAHDTHIEAFDQLDNLEKFIKDPSAVIPQFSENIQEALKRLPEKRRSIFLLRVVAELSYKEIAELCEVPQGSVMSELFRARKTLRELLLRGKNDAKDISRKDDPSHEV